MADPRSLKAGPGARLRWLEAVASHPETTAFDVVVALGVSRATDSATGKAMISQVALQRFSGAKSDRSIRGSLERLSRHGLLRIDRSEIQRKGGSRRAWGGAGRGLCNVYEPVLPSKTVIEIRNEHSEKEERRFRNGGKAVPHLPSSSNSFLSDGERAILHSEESASSDHRWHSIKNKIEEFVGHENFVSWFASARLRLISDTEIVIEVPTKFMRNTIENRFSDEIVRAARATDTACSVTIARLVLPLPTLETAR